jgi:hypothetical protein
VATNGHGLRVDLGRYVAEGSGWLVPHGGGAGSDPRMVAGRLGPWVDVQAVVDGWWRAEKVMGPNTAGTVTARRDATRGLISAECLLVALQSG